ncbi:MAG: DUF2059 domain-containing protein [Novosphingobium sp.]
MAPFKIFAMAGSMMLPAFVVPAAKAAEPAASTTAQSDALDPAKVEVARQIIATGYPVDKREAIFSNAIDAMLVQMRSTMLSSLKNDPGAEKLVNTKVDSFIGESKTILNGHIPALMDAMAQAYSREFSLAELAELKAFASTPTGQHFFLRNSAVLSDPSFRAANEAYMRELMPTIDKMREAIIRDLTAYFAKHPPKPSSGS